MHNNTLINPKEKPRYHHLDVYKGVCMFLIILTHFRWEAGERLKYFFPFWVDMAVPCLMVITGYLYAMSFCKKGLSLKKAYSIDSLLSKWFRFLIPFFPVFLIELLIKVLYLKEQFSFSPILKLFMTGGSGPGSYYFPVMLQIVVLLPLMIVTIKKYRIKGLLIWFSINLLFEIAKTLTNMDGGLYRLLSFRYLFVLAWGVYLYFELNQTDKDLTEFQLSDIILTGGGIIYIIAFSYAGFTPLITTLWTTTSLFACMLIMPLMAHLIRKNHIRNRLLENFGNASFEIFLIQMFYYWGLARYIYQYIANPFLQIIIGVIFSLALGFIYYKIECPLQKKLIACVQH